MRFDQEQINTFSEKFIYKLANNVPEHKGAYEMIAISLTFVDATFAGKMFKQFKDKLMTFEKESNPEKKVVEWEFLQPIEGSLHTASEAMLKWYAGLLQCLFQYHPSNVVKHWPDIEALIVFLIREW